MMWSQLWVKDFYHCVLKYILVYLRQNKGWWWLIPAVSTQGKCFGLNNTVWLKKKVMFLFYFHIPWFLSIRKDAIWKYFETDKIHIFMKSLGSQNSNQWKQQFWNKSFQNQTHLLQEALLFSLHAQKLWVVMESQVRRNVLINFCWLRDSHIDSN